MWDKSFWRAHLIREPMLKTPLNERHRRLGARMVSFAGWDMPVQFTGIIEEHLAVRKRSGAFDISHMGNFIIRGPGAKALVSALCTNDVVSAPEGRCVYSHLLNEEGHILDDTIATVLGNDEYYMVPNAATTPKMRSWIEQHLSGQVLVDESRKLAAIAVQGPTARDVLAELTSADLDALKPFWAAFVRLDRVDGGDTEPSTELLRDRETIDGAKRGVPAFVSRTGYTGEDGFEISVENVHVGRLWDAVLEKGEAHGLVPVGLGARDTLRLEKCLLLSGADFDGGQTSLQTGPDWVVDWGHEFIGKGTLELQKASGGYQRLVAVLAEGKGIPRHGYEILSEGEAIGRVTSGTLSPVLRNGIALGYVPLDKSEAGRRIQIRIRDSVVDAVIVKPPFVKRESR